MCAGLVLIGAALGFAWMQDVRGPSRAEISARPFETAPERPRIVAIGTSLTASYDWPAVLSVWLGDCLMRPVQLSVVAQAGETSRWGYAQTERVIAAKPDVVILEFIANDADLRHHLGVAESLDLHARTLARIYAALPDARVVLIGTNPVYGLRAAMRPRTQAYLDGYGTLAAHDPRTGFLDTADVWQTYLEQSGRRVVLPDGLHPRLRDIRHVLVPQIGHTLATLWGYDCPATFT